MLYQYNSKSNGNNKAVALPASWALAPLLWIISLSTLLQELPALQPPLPLHAQTPTHARPPVGVCPSNSHSRHTCSHTCTNGKQNIIHL